MAVNRRALLTRYGATRQAVPPIIACDIETAGLGGDFLYGGYLREGDGEVIHHFFTCAAWLAAILAPENAGHVWYAHNGGEYDYKYLLPELMPYLADGYHVRLVAQGQRVIGLVITRGHRTWKLLDSYALMPASLDTISRTFAPEHAKLAFDHEHTRFNPANPDHVAYLDQDIRGLLASLRSFMQLIYAQFGVPCGWTIGATALLAWRHTIPARAGYWRARAGAELFCRDGYYGGLVWLSRTTRQHDLITLDINSAYPAVMRAIGVPVGLPIYTDIYHAGLPGFYRVRVDVPRDIPMSFVPLRTREGVCWATGQFETTITDLEIEQALRYGCAVTVRDGYYWREHLPIFTTFVNTCEQLRLAHPGTAIESAVKLLQNSLYGKFGTRPEIISLTLADDLPNDAWQPFVDEQTGGLVDHLYSTEQTLNKPYMHVEWAAYITAAQRMRLVNLCRVVGHDQVIYTDTDSLTASRAAVLDAVARGAIVLSTRYGDLKVEKEYAWFQAAGPKHYVGELSNGVLVHRAKGVPRSRITDSGHLAALAGDDTPVRYDSMTGTLAMLKHGSPRAVVRTRRYSAIANSKNWTVDISGDVRPRHVVKSE